MSNKNILTGIVCALALILVVVVIFVKTGVFEGTEPETEIETIIETEIVVETVTNEDGSVEQVTWLNYYPKPKYSSNHTYPTTKKKTTVPESTESTTAPFVDMTKFIPVTDENGMPQFDENGNPFTEVMTYTVAASDITTAPSTTEYVPKYSGVVVTGFMGKTEVDENGNPVTVLVTLEAPPTTQADIWSQNVQSGTTEKGGINIPTNINRDDNLAQAVVDQINRDRQAAGLAPLEHATGLKANARTNSTAMALPDIYGNDRVAGAYEDITTYGGNAVYQRAAAANNAKIMSADTTKIGVGVVVYEGKYYTTVLFS